MGSPLAASRILPPLVLALAGVAHGGSFTVHSWPPVAVVAFGGSVTINCSHTSCPGDKATLALDTPLVATPGPGGQLWQSFWLPNVSLWRPDPVTCSGRCGDTEATASTAVIVYKLPQLVALDPVPALPVGHIHPLTCHVLDVAPLGNLTVTLRRGTETLRTATFGDSEGSASVAVSHELPVARGDHGQAVTCHAELSLRPHGPLFARGAAPVVLSVFDLPEPPHLEAPPILEVATLANATCHLIGAFPVTDINITVTLGGDPLDVTTVTHGDKVTTRAELAPLRPGHHELSCTAQVATVAKTARRKIHVYRVPEVALELSPARVAAGEEVTVTCRAGDTPEMLGDTLETPGDTSETPGDTST
ncbi:intercellular adhesion molecule 1-like [Catharus ustulatus]|uniref:intercellular adhesion molecule 1-like n=1 Tax=Catharus ustulatus TaxID=91951 RepID=UPI001409EE69|nr:intercellular adhesion molecule 1-like [Catharus ustulatus]